MSLDLFVFFFFTLLTLGGGLAAILLRTAVHSAIALMVSLLGVAGLFLHLQAEFLFATQIIAYIGGILLLILMVIMLVNLDRMATARRFYRIWPVGAAAGILLFAFLVNLLLQGKAPLVQKQVTDAAALGNTEQIGNQLLSSYLLPFEVVSLLLLAALTGSVLLARQQKEEAE